MSINTAVFIAALEAYIDAKVLAGCRDPGESGDFSTCREREALTQALVDLLSNEGARK